MIKRSLPVPDGLTQWNLDKRGDDLYQDVDGVYKEDSYLLPDNIRGRKHRIVQPGRGYNFTEAEQIKTTYVTPVGEFDITVVFKFDIVVDQWDKIFDSVGISQQGGGIRMQNLVGSGITFYFVGDPWTTNVTTPTTLFDGVWHELIAKVRASTIELYLDGTLVDSATNNGVVTGFYDMVIGADAESGINKSRATLAKLVFTDINEVILFDINGDESQGLSSFDASGNGKHGVINLGGKAESSFHTTDIGIVSVQNKIGYNYLGIIGTRAAFTFTNQNTHYLVVSTSYDILDIRLKYIFRFTVTVATNYVLIRWGSTNGTQYGQNIHNGSLAVGDYVFYVYPESDWPYVYPTRVYFYTSGGVVPWSIINASVEVATLIPLNQSNPTHDVLGNAVPNNYLGQVRYDSLITYGQRQFRSVGRLPWVSVALSTPASQMSQYIVRAKFILHTAGSATREVIFYFGLDASYQKQGFYFRQHNSNQLLAYARRNDGVAILIYSSVIDSFPPVIGKVYDFVFVKSGVGWQCYVDGVASISGTSNTSGSIVRTGPATICATPTNSDGSLTSVNDNDITFYHFEAAPYSVANQEKALAKQPMDNSILRWLFEGNKTNSGVQTIVYNSAVDRGIGHGTIYTGGSTSFWKRLEDKAVPYSFLYGANLVGGVWVPAAPESNGTLDVLGDPLVPISRVNSLIDSDVGINRNLKSAPELAELNILSTEDLEYADIIADESRFYDKSESNRMVSLLASAGFVEPIAGSRFRFDNNLFLGSTTLMNGIAVNNSFKVRMVIYFISFNANNTFFEIGATSTANGLGMRVTSTGLVRFMANGVWDTNTTLSTGVWYDIIFTRSGITVNGVYTTYSTTGNVIKADNSIYVGNRYPGTAQDQKMNAYCKVFEYYELSTDTIPNLNHVFSEEKGLKSFDLKKVGLLDVNLTGSSDGTQWNVATNKDYHHNLLYGYHDDGFSLVPGDPENLGFDVNGDPIDNLEQVIKYRRIINYLRR